MIDAANPELTVIGLTSLLSGLVGGGVLYWALVGRLGDRFASAEDREKDRAHMDRKFQEVDNRLDRIAADGADRNNRLTALQERGKADRDRHDELHKDVRAMSTRLDAIAQHQTATATTLDALLQEFRAHREDFKHRRDP